MLSAYERVRSEPPFNSGSLKTAPEVVKTSMIELLAPFVKQSEALAAMKKS